MAFSPSQFPSKLPSVKTTIFTVMSKLAKEQGALNLSQGFPDFESPKKLVEEVNKAMLSGLNQYAPMAGIAELREIISEKFSKLYNQYYCPESEITITSGATQAIYTAISTFVNKGDEVVLLKPCFDCYEPAIEINGGIPVYVQLKSPDYKVDWEEFKKKISSKTKMVIINTPNNPTGTLLEKKDLLALQEILKGTNILLLCDDVYEHIIYDGQTHQSACLYPYLKERAIIASSFGKTFHITGWKVGYCLAPKELMHEFRKAHQFTVFCVSHPFQKAIANYLKEPQHYLELNNFYQNKRNLFLDNLKGSKFKFTPSKGTYFQLLDYTNITQEHDVDYAIRMVKEHKIASIPISPFNTNAIDPKTLRFCFAKKDETLKKAADLLCKIN
ncbi:methionine aminotransferase [Flavicella sediminum]|uniref:methionine aminotransferase n=1 Tax=Flavicella sediminum TaxID=2585141 RepID=UPI001120A9BA|nr:methionine aminotransferase [Flavicella sediminum]